MTAKLIAGRSTVWPALRAAFEKEQRAHVAVAFLGQSATRRMPLVAGSVLVVNAAEQTVRSGQTDPREILRYLAKGVRVYTDDSLHAKVFVIGRMTFVGSANVSSSSESHLTEAVIGTSDTAIRKQARQFISDLAVRPIGPEMARRLKSLYRPPKLEVHGAPRPMKSTRPLLVSLRTDNWSEAEQDAMNRGLPEATRRIKDSRHFRIEEFSFVGSSWTAQFLKGRQVYQVVTGPDGKKRLHPPGDVLVTKPFTDGRRKGAIIFIELPKNRRARTVTSIHTRLGTTKHAISKLRGTRQIRSDAEAALLARIFA